MYKLLKHRVTTLHDQPTHVLAGLYLFFSRNTEKFLFSCISSALKHILLLSCNHEVHNRSSVFHYQNTVIRIGIIELLFNTKPLCKSHTSMFSMHIKCVVQYMTCTKCYTWHVEPIDRFYLLVPLLVQTMYSSSALAGLSLRTGVQPVDTLVTWFSLLRGVCITRARLGPGCNHTIIIRQFVGMVLHC